MKKIKIDTCEIAGPTNDLLVFDSRDANNIPVVSQAMQYQSGSSTATFIIAFYNKTEGIFLRDYTVPVTAASKTYFFIFL